MDFVRSVSGDNRVVLAVVEDLAIRAVLRRGLQNEGYQVRFRTGPVGDLSTEICAGVDCLILDMGDLRKETAGLVRTLRTDGCLAPILILAGDPAVDDVFQVIHAGADDFLRKPIQGPEHVALAMRRLSAFRCCMLENESLRREQERARKEESLHLDRLKFFRFASHELKSPLVAIRSSLRAAQELAGTSMDERIRNLLDRSVGRTDQMLDMINDLLAISVDRSDIRDYYQEVDLVSLVRDAIAGQLPVLEEKACSLVTSFPADPIRILCNRYGIEKVATNLLSNACRYTPEGGRVEVLVWVEQGHAMLRVVDTGIGIPAEDHERIFDEFYRARNARKAVSFGSGLGLSLVRKVVHEHGGWIDLASEEGKGSSFTAWIPLRRPSE
ncbi:MAG: hypothetical protein FJ098_00500 [Deltaproteobacteria bacterium]|nr:hypothetical protein [Deltaproteobacteria bacterium]